MTYSNSQKDTFRSQIFNVLTFRCHSLAGGLYNFSSENDKKINIEWWLKPSYINEGWILPVRETNWVLELR